MPIEILEDRIAPAAFAVVTLADSGVGSLRNAIALVDTSTDATNNIIFASALHGTIVLKSPLPAITVSLTIGGTTDAKIKISGNNDFQIFNISGNGLAVNINGLTLMHGNNENVGLTRSPGGGAVYANDYSGTVKILDCIITKNRALGATGATRASAGQGGAVDLVAGTMTITSSKITGNLAEGGSSTTPGAAGAVGEGGGVYVGSSGTLTVNLSTISGNIARGGNGTTGAAGTTGGGGTGGQGGIGEGGGLWNYGIITVDKSTISGNTAMGGRGANGGAGGTGSSGGSGGSGGIGEGGGVYNASSAGPNPFAFTLNSSTVSGNAADGNVGGAGGRKGQGGASAGGHGGKSMGYGGGVHSANATLELVDATVAKNVADIGGGLYIYGDDATQLDNSTIAFNRARSHIGAYGGGLAGTIDSGEPLFVISTVIADNSAGARGAGQDLWLNANNSSVPIAAFDSLIESYIPGSVSTPNAAFPDILTGKNPLLDPLHANGGPTLTCKPASYKSPLIAAGTVPIDLGSEVPNLPTVNYDQRGDSREIPSKDGTVDIGSVEVA